MAEGEKFTDIQLEDLDSPICNKCFHYKKRTLVCTAYPNGIPFQILQNLADHTKPYPEDNGIRFKKIKNK